MLDNSTAVRGFGAIAVVMGCFLGYTGVYTTLVEALASKQSFYVHSGAVGSSLIAIVCGMIMLIAGRHTRKLLLHRWYNATLLNFIVTLLVVALAIVADRYFEWLLIGLGYEFLR